uniref:Uncharacterized protein n=1 Tax=Rhizophora mucronata TaxID=61149 RepID=A0A2P2IY35_RHIMU
MILINQCAVSLGNNGTLVWRSWNEEILMLNAK